MLSSIMKKWMERTEDTVTGFTKKERLMARICYYSMLFIAFATLSSHSGSLGVIYLFILILTNAYVVYGLCTNCVYPWEYNDCLFVPGWLVSAILPRRSGVIKPEEKKYIMISFAIMILFPQIWLIRHMFVFLLFWLLALPLLVYFPLVLCKGCKNNTCPCNKQ